ncbi:hypothetical protein [Methylobacterium sp. SD21]|uniref:hypothetical protein n=1 Tax=Methylobacterium litchii TaxID=3138810 RepID=UPI00313B74BA
MLNYIAEKLNDWVKNDRKNIEKMSVSDLLLAYRENPAVSRPYVYDNIKNCLPFHVCLHEAGHYMMALKYKMSVNSVTLMRVVLNDASSVRGSVVRLDNEEFETETKPYVSFALGGCMGEISSFITENDFKETGNAIFNPVSSVGDAKRAISKQFKLNDRDKQTRLNEFDHGEDRARSEILTLVRNFCLDDLDYMFKNIDGHDLYAKKMYDAWRSNNFQKTKLDKNLEIDNRIA